MTGDPLLDLLISVLGVALLVGVCAALGGWRTAALVGEADAAARLHAELPDFHPTRWVIAGDGLSALAMGEDDVVVLRVLGDGTAVRRAPRAVVSDRGDRLRVDVGDPSFPPFDLRVAR